MPDLDIDLLLKSMRDNRIEPIEYARRKWFLMVVPSKWFPQMKGLVKEKRAREVKNRQLLHRLGIMFRVKRAWLTNA